MERISVEAWPRVRLRFHAGLKREREASGLSQRHLAQSCGCSHSTISKIEAGLLLPSHRMATRLATGLGVRVEELVR